MLKSWTSDEMEMSSELCLATALTQPIGCLMEIIRQLVDYVLFDYSSSSASLRDGTDKLYMRYWQQHHFQNVPINKTSATVMAKMLVRAFILLLWANDDFNLNKKTLRKRKHSPDEAGENSLKLEYDLRNSSANYETENSNFTFLKI